MQRSQIQEHNTETTRLRSEINEWKQKYYDCRRKVVPQAQYVRTAYHTRLILRLTMTLVSEMTQAIRLCVEWDVKCAYSLTHSR